MIKVEKPLSAKAVGEILYNNELEHIYEYIRERRWFKQKSETIKAVKFRDFAILCESPIEILTIIEIYFDNLKSEAYYFPVMAIFGDEERVKKLEPIEHLCFQDKDVILYDAFTDERFCSNLLKLIKTNKQIKATEGVFSFYPTKIFQTYDYSKGEKHIELIKSEQSNTSINFNNALIMKNYRSIEYGINPDFEVSYYLTEKTDLKNFPPLLGYIEYQNQSKLKATTAVLQEYVSNQGDCWNYTLFLLSDLYRIALRNCQYTDEHKIRQIIEEFCKDYLINIERLGEVTGEFHKALTTKKDDDDEAFRSEFICDEDIDHWINLMIADVEKVLGKIEANITSYTEEVQNKVKVILENKEFLENVIRRLEVMKGVKQKKIRIHGDYHLAQVLKTEEDFVILDFEGEPIRSVEERRAKNLPQKDVGGMLRSFNYAAYSGLFELPTIFDEFMNKLLRKWAHSWELLCREAYLKGYCKVMSDELPEKEILEATLTAFMIDKAIYELEYEINNRPDWLKIPVEYLESLITTGQKIL